MKMLENLSYWEHKHLSTKRDLIIVGAGIVGLMTAYHYKLKHPSHSILILERGLMPDGASTKNAGFACFGSAGELLADLTAMPEESVWSTVKMRFEGLLLLREILGDTALKYEPLGGYELFTSEEAFQKVAGKLAQLNLTMQQVIGKACYSAHNTQHFGFPSSVRMIKNELEGQIDTAAMMWALLSKVLSMQIEIQYAAKVTAVLSQETEVKIESNFCTHAAANCVIATNAFASQLLPSIQVIPGRAQVLVTEPIANLKIKGSFHFDEGYYYFRNIDNRILFGGGRNLDFEGEKSYQNGVSDLIQNKLELLLKNLVVPNTDVKIAARWSGIMGLGNEKKPIIQKVGNRVIAAVRMGGMGIAIGSKVGYLAAEMLE